MKYHDITKVDLLNGEGLRTVLWVSGCEMNCKGCQNPQTWDPNDGLEFDEDARKELFSYLEKEYISGITFSGGHPLHPANVETILGLINEIRTSYKDKTIWTYTGYDFAYVMSDYYIANRNKVKESDAKKIISMRRDILVSSDVVVDDPFIEEKKDVNYHWAGSTNQKVIDVKETMKKLAMDFCILDDISEENINFPFVYNLLTNDIVLYDN